MLTLSQLLYASNPKAISALGSYYADALKKEAASSTVTVYKALVQGGSKGRIATIAFHGAVEAATPVVVRCTCESFAYNYAYALTAKGSADSAGLEYPIRKNPNLRPGLCVHLLFLARAAIAEAANKNP